jgi:hypothetical protein
MWPGARNASLRSQRTAVPKPSAAGSKAHIQITVSGESSFHRYPAQRQSPHWASVYMWMTGPSKFLILRMMGGDLTRRE